MRPLTAQLLTFSKGGLPIKNNLRLSELVPETSEFALRGSNVRCELALPSGLWQIRADSGQIGQVIHNLLLNAAQSMPGGGVVRVACSNCEIAANEIAKVEAGPYVELSVEDHGVGIRKEDLPRIFDPYFTTKGEGSGLGRVCVTGVGLYLGSFFWSQYCCIYTTGGDLMDTARTLEEKRERVLEQMRAIRSMRPGSVTEQYLKVTHKGKRKPVMRGPYWVYTRKEAGKTVGQRLSREDAEQVTKDIEAHRKFVALCKEFETLTMRLGDVEVDAVLAPEKKRPRSRSSRTKR